MAVPFRSRFHLRTCLWFVCRNKPRRPARPGDSETASLDHTANDLCGQPAFPNAPSTIVLRNDPPEGHEKSGFMLVISIHRRHSVADAAVCFVTRCGWSATPTLQAWKYLPMEVGICRVRLSRLRQLANTTPFQNVPQGR